MHCEVLIEQVVLSLCCKVSCYLIELICRRFALSYFSVIFYFYFFLCREYLMMNQAKVFAVMIAMCLVMSMMIDSW